ncbi:hypothetical protein R6Z07F_020341 [Ovis aries]
MAAAAQVSGHPEAGLGVGRGGGRLAAARCGWSAQWVTGAQLPAGEPDRVQVCRGEAWLARRRRPLQGWAWWLQQREPGALFLEQRQALRGRGHEHGGDRGHPKLHPSPTLFFRPFSPSSASILRLCTSNHLLRRAVPVQAPVWLTAPPTSALGPPPGKRWVVDMCAEDQDGDIAGQAVYAAINCMLDQVNACLDHLEERKDHLPGRLRECLNLAGRHILRPSSCSGRPQVIGSP